jgi:hypothetical protein
MIVLRGIDGRYRREIATTNQIPTLTIHVPDGAYLQVFSLVLTTFSHLIPPLELGIVYA